MIIATCGGYSKGHRGGVQSRRSGGMLALARTTQQMSAPRAGDPARRPTATLTAHIACESILW